MNLVARLDFSIMGDGVEYSPLGHVSISAKMEKAISKTFMEISSILSDNNFISDEAYSETNHSVMSIVEPNKSFSLDNVIEIAKKLTEKGYNIAEFSYIGIPDKFFDKEPYIHFSILCK